MSIVLSSLTLLTDEESRSITVENPTGVKGRSGMATSTLGPGRKGSPCRRSIQSGETVVVADIEGAKEIRHIWLTIGARTSHGDTVYRDLVLRMYWDNERDASVEVPLGDFLCNGFSIPAEVVSLPTNVNPSGGFNSYWPMPFSTGARIEIENQHIGEIDALFYQVDYALFQSRPVDNEIPSRFHAQWRRQSATTAGDDYVIVNGIRGRGHYVGTYLALETLERHWYGEGR